MTNPKTATWYLGDSADLESKLDTVDAVVDGIAATIATGGFGSAKAIKAVTFSNTSGAVNLFTVTGDVIARIIAIVKTVVASAGGCNGSVGIAGATAAIIASTDITLMAADEIWHDNSPDALIEAMSVAGAAGFIISGGKDIVLTLSAQADSGAVTFYCLWSPLSADGAVVAA